MTIHELRRAIETAKEIKKQRADKFGKVTTVALARASFSVVVMAETFLNELEEARMKPGNKYRPSNGTDGEAFEAHFCDRCRHEDPDKEKWCNIHTMALGCYTDDTEYPKEWTYTDAGKPTCTAFQALPTPDEIEAEAGRKRQARIQAENKRLEEQGQLSMLDLMETTA